jgi:autotransporter-associated beta strand protein
MNTVMHPKFNLRFMKRFALIASLLALPLAATAQFTVFTDSFTSGSTTNHSSNPGGTPFASFTSYDIAASKAAVTNCPIANGDFKIALDGNSGTSSGGIEAQAIFTKAPITLVNIGDYINLTYIFRMTNALPTSSAYLGQGLYYSGGLPPVPGGLNNSGLSGVAGSPFATGNCQLWQGIFSRIVSGGNSSCISRPPQTNAATTSANQSLIVSGVTGGFANPSGTTLGGSTNAGTLTLTPGAYYTISYTITLADTNTPTLTITNVLYTGAGTGGTVLMVMTNVATGATFQNSFDGLAFGRRETGSVPIAMDITNITISENIFGLPGQPFNVTGGGLGCPGNTFPVGLNGSVTTNDYYLYTNGVWNGVVQTGTGSTLSFPAETVITDPLTNTVFASNTVSGFTAFMLGSVVVASEAPPSITSQPIPMIVANGSIGVFGVSATGGGLTYKWYKSGIPLTDSVGHISGSATPTLVISPVSAGDAAGTAQGYYCVVTSGCNISLPTTTNSLTISAPANLIWQGGNPNTNWDLSTTANFGNGASSVVFHNGDNVTFDDTSLVPVLSIANNFIAPTLMTDSANQSYIFNGPGVIQGPGALVISGAGSLSINNSNAFTGGTTINSGMLILSNQFSVGPAPITIAGGTLDIPLSFGSAVGLSNNINVTANSTLQFEQRGTFACVLNGALTGNSAATLNINAVNATLPSTSRMRLYGAFTNNANVNLSSAAGTEIEFAPYLPSGNQVFNGIISGSGGHIVPRGGGSIILNNTNTFNDSGANPASGYSLFMSSGNVGIGADSVSSTPPTINASPVGTGIVGINVGPEGGSCAFFASGGAHTIANLFAYTSSTNTVTVTFGGTNNLTLAGEFDLANSGETAGTNRTLQVTNTAATTISGAVSDKGVSGGAGIIKTGNGALYLNGLNTYTGPTTNNAGLLAGSGTIAGPVDVETNGSIGGGSAAAIGTLTVNNSLTLNGNVSIRVNKALSPAQSNDLVSVSGTLSSTGIGTLTVNNVGTALVVGDKFKVFNKLVTGAGAMTITGGGMNWANNLAVDGSITATSVNSGPATNPTNIVFAVGGGNLSLSWPGDHLGWYLQMQTNNLTNTATWFDVAGSSTVTNVVIPFNQSLHAVFFRMSLQP